MRKLLLTPLVSAVIGGGVTAAVLIATGVVTTGDTTLVYQQSPLSTAAATGDDAALTARDIYKRDAPGVAYVKATTISDSKSPFDVMDPATSTQESTGSGFVIDDDGHILTNAHVIDNATAVSVTLSGSQTVSASVVGKDESTDLALLKVDPDGLHLEPLALGNSGAVQVGDPTVAIGNPFGFDRTLTTGVVSALQRRITAPDGYAIENVIQTDAALNPGNSGGPLIDAAGRVIGINSQIATGGSTGSVGIGFAVPIDTAKTVLAELKAHGRVERPWLGIEFVPVDPTIETGMRATRGLLVQSVRPGSPCARAGIQGGNRSVMLTSGTQLLVGGDVITSIDGVSTTATTDVAHALKHHEAGDTVPVVVNRDGSPRTFQVTLDNRPAGGGS